MDPLDFERGGDQDHNNLNRLWQGYQRLEEARRDALPFKDFCELRNHRRTNRAWESNINSQD